MDRKRIWNVVSNATVLKFTKFIPSWNIVYNIISLVCSWVPVYVDKEQTLAVMSIAFLLNNKDDAVVWRGPKKTGEYVEYIL